MESLCFKQLRIEWLERLTCRSRRSQGYPLRFYSTENSEEPFCAKRFKPSQAISSQRSPLDSPHTPMLNQPWNLKLGHSVVLGGWCLVLCVLAGWVFRHWVFPFPLFKTP